jgi:hypothetical protein
MLDLQFRRRNPFVPGTRFQIGGDWYFLNYWEFQPRSNDPFDFQMQAAIVKAF